MALNIVLVNPEIPQNTGNISRTCVVTGSTLHIIKPMGFSLDEKQIRRAGLDYWPDLNLKVYENIEIFMAQHGGAQMHFFTTKTAKRFDEATYSDNCFLLFGCETKGLPERLRDPERSVRIPMLGGQRCLNLSNAVCVAAYEALRQNGYQDLI